MRTGTSQSTAIEETSTAVRRQADLRGGISKEAEQASFAFPVHRIDFSIAVCPRKCLS